MGWFKRLCLFVFGLAGILALVALSLPWVGSYTREATELIYQPEYFQVLEVLVCIVGLGCAICFLRALFTPRNRKNIIIAKEGGDQITVTRAAIASQAEHIVERDGTCVAGTVRVRARKHGNVKVYVRVTPKRSLNVVEKGEQLHAELDEGLAQIAADKIRSVNLEFTDPEEMDVSASVPLSSSADELGSGSYDESAEAPAYAPSSYDAGADEDDGANGITVSMSSFRSSSDGSVAPEADATADAGAGAEAPVAPLAAEAPEAEAPEPDASEPVDAPESGDEAAVAEDEPAEDAAEEE